MPFLFTDWYWYSWVITAQFCGDIEIQHFTEYYSNEYGCDL
jgi:hypothetical protein